MRTSPDQLKPIAHASLPTLPYFPTLQDRPSHVPPADEEKLQILGATWAQILVSPDPELQLTWAQDVFSFMDGYMEDGRRMAQVRGSKAQTASIEGQLRTDALNIIMFLANQHHPRAEYVKGMWFEFGKFGFLKDKPEAFRCYKRAAARGLIRAEYRLGMQYEFTNEPIKALQHYRAGLQRGDAASSYRMGMVTLLGQLGEPQDYRRAIYLIRQAANAADENAPQGAYVLGMLQARELPQITIPEDYLTFDLVEARHHIEKAAYLGFSKAQLKMGSAYELCSLGCEFSPSLSLHYNVLAARQGEVEAEMSISKWFLCGYDGLFRRNEEIAYTYAHRAALNGSHTAEFAMGYYHEIGICVTVDLRKAKSWYEKAARHGNSDAVDRIQGLNKARVLSRDDHEEIALTRIKSRHGSRRGQRPSRLMETSPSVPPLPAMTSGDKDPRKKFDVEESTSRPIKLNVSGTLESKVRPNPRSPAGKHSNTPSDMPQSRVVDQATSVNNVLSSPQSPRTPSSGFLRLDLDDTSFSDMVGYSRGPSQPSRRSTAPLQSRNDATPSHTGSGDTLIDRSLATTYKMPERTSQRQSGPAGTPTNSIRLDTHTTHTTTPEALAYDLANMTGGLNIGYPVRENAIVLEEPSAQSRVRRQLESRATEPNKMAPRTLQRHYASTTAQPLQSSSPLSTPRSTPRSQSDSFQTSSAPTTPRMSTLSGDSNDVFEASRFSEKPPKRGPQTFEEMGVPLGKNENDCLVM